MKYPIYITLILLCTFLLSLYIFIKLFNNNLTLFFGNMNRKLYIFSTILCIILFLPFIYYINVVKFNNSKIYSIFFNLLIMIISFILWITSIYYKNSLYRNISIIIIIIVNINLIYILLNSENKTNFQYLHFLSIIGLYYLLFHHFFIDFVLWNKYSINL